LRILAVETSCDDSAVALLEEGGIAWEAVADQPVHAEFGGVVPEIASRLHLSTLPRMISSLLDSTCLSIRDVDVFAATAGPGLTGSLLVGLSWAKAAAWASGRSFLGINHLSAHLHIHYGTGREVIFPAVALLVSGGHTSLFQMHGWNDCRLLGSTRDDAAGEAFDKIAKLMDLGYPGGSVIDRIAGRGDPSSVDLPSPLGDPSLPEFSFSGLKTAVRLRWEKGVDACDMAASFQRVVVELLVSKLMYQAERTAAASVLLAGGVSANSELREKLRVICSNRGLNLFLPEKKYATDNAVMVARAATAVLDRNPDASTPVSCNVFSTWKGDMLEPLVDHSGRT
jgi:N6-L-threonylcarbamoyladenine synthase